jgi:hypothetical protein
VERLPDCDAESENEQDDERSNAPAHELLAAAAPAALIALDRSQRAHGT